MAYTSFSPNDERFGFSMKGSFRCAYENQRIVILVFVGGLIFLAVVFFGVLFMTGHLVANPEMPDFNETSKTVIGRMDIFGFDVAVYGSYLALMIAILCIEGLGIIAFLVVLGVLRTGKSYSFTANETHFEIIPPEKEESRIVIDYNDVVIIYAEERRFLFAEHGLDVTVKLKKGSHFFRYIHTSESRIHGLSDTPFNIIQERAGLVRRPDMLI